MDNWALGERARPLAAAFTTIVIVLAFILEEMHRTRPSRCAEPSLFRDLTRKRHMNRILRSGRDYCVRYLRMDVGPFMHLSQIMRDRHLLVDTRHVSIEEQLAIFLHIVGHNTKIKTLQVKFLRSGVTIRRYFNNVIHAICAIRDDFVLPASSSCHPDIENNPSWYPFFKDCIGLLDGTHIDASVPPQELPRFCGQKGPTQNVLAVVNPDMKFTYFLAGWEGSANDFTVLRDAISRPQPEGLKIMEGKYYLVDSKYTTMNGFIAPYKGVRYHLKEHSGRTPTNPKELFNLRHSMLRSRVERAFAILKNRFKILTSRPFFPIKTQVTIVLTCCILHNYIASIDPTDRILHEETPQEEEHLVPSHSWPQREQHEENRQWVELRDKIALEMWNQYIGQL